MTPPMLVLVLSLRTVELGYLILTILACFNGCVGAGWTMVGSGAGVSVVVGAPGPVGCSGVVMGAVTTGAGSRNGGRMERSSPTSTEMPERESRSAPSLLAVTT